MKTPQQMADNWTKGMSGAGAAYTAGINNYQGNPMALAASPEAQQRYIQNTADAAESGRMAKKLNAVSPAYWKAQATGAGAANLASGARKAATKVANFFQRWAPIYAQASAAARALPKGGRDNALARVGAAIDVMMAAKGT